MRYQITALKLVLREQLRKRRVWAALLLLLAAGAVVRCAAAPAKETDAAVRVGVVLPSGGAEAFQQGLEARNSPAVRFIFTDEATVLQMVAASRWDCGLIVAEDFEERMAASDFDGLVTLVTGPGSAAYPLVRETAAAVIAGQAAPLIAEEYLRSSGIADETAIASMQPRLRQILPDAQRVGVELETLDGAALQMQALADEGTAQALRGLLALALMVWMLFAAVDLGRWKETPAARRMRPHQSGVALLLPRLLGAALPALCAGALGLLASAVSHTAAGVMSLLPYLAMLGALALLLAGTRQGWAALPVLLPFVVVACLVLSPVFVDITLLYPRLAVFTQWLPVTLYLQSSVGDPAAVGRMLLLAALFLAAAALRERAEK